jgi:hypothetical protein
MQPSQEYLNMDSFDESNGAFPYPKVIHVLFLDEIIYVTTWESRQLPSRAWSLFGL